MIAPRTRNRMPDRGRSASNAPKLLGSVLLWAKALISFWRCGVIVTTIMASALCGQVKAQPLYQYIVSAEEIDRSTAESLKPNTWEIWLNRKDTEPSDRADASQHWGTIEGDNLNQALERWERAKDFAVRYNRWCGCDGFGSEVESAGFGPVAVMNNSILATRRFEMLSHDQNKMTVYYSIRTMWRDLTKFRDYFYENNGPKVLDGKPTAQRSIYREYADTLHDADLKLTRLQASFTSEGDGKQDLEIFHAVKQDFSSLDQLIPSIQGTGRTSQPNTLSTGFLTPLRDPTPGGRRPIQESMGFSASSHEPEPAPKVADPTGNGLVQNVIAAQPANLVQSILQQPTPDITPAPARENVSFSIRLPHEVEVIRVTTAEIQVDHTNTSEPSRWVFPIKQVSLWVPKRPDDGVWQVDAECKTSRTCIQSGKKMYQNSQISIMFEKRAQMEAFLGSALVNGTSVTWDE
jgi:hypothetical protein